MEDEKTSIQRELEHMKEENQKIKANYEALKEKELNRVVTQDRMKTAEVEMYESTIADLKKQN